jgi:hypothetical protein
VVSYNFHIYKSNNRISSARLATEISPLRERFFHAARRLQERKKPPRTPLVLSQKSRRSHAELLAALVRVEGHVKVATKVAGPDRFPIQRRIQDVAANL